MSDASTKREQDRIRGVTESLARAIEARDVERTRSHYGPDAVVFSLAPPLRSRGLGWLSAWFATWSSPAIDLRP